jgi:hypothetical protein
VKMHTDQIAAVVMNHRTLNLAYIRLVYRIWSLLNNPYNPCSPSYRCSAPTATTTMPLRERLNMPKALPQGAPLPWAKLRRRAS